MIAVHASVAVVSTTIFKCQEESRPNTLKVFWIASVARARCREKTKVTANALSSAAAKLM